MRRQSKAISSNTVRLFHGLLSDVRIYRKPLTAAEVNNMVKDAAPAK